MFFDLAGFFHFVYEEVGGVVHVEDVEIILHCHSDGVEHFFAFGAADGDGHSSSVPAGGFDERFFEDVFVRPEALAAVDEKLCLGADGHKEDGSREDEAVGFEHLRGEQLIVVLNGTFSGFVAGVAFDAWGDVEVGEADVFGLGVCRLGAD